MADKPSTTTVTVFVRHGTYKGKICPKTDPGWKQCKCRKSLYIYDGSKTTGKTKYMSARTRSWEQAEKLAQVERDKRDPGKILIQEIKAEEAKKAAAIKGGTLTVEVAVGRWLLSLPEEKEVTQTVRNRAAWRIKEWAKDQKIETVRDVTPDALDLWRGQWSKTAEKRYSRIGKTSQSQFQGRLKSFFVWCLATRNIDLDPSALLRPVNPGKTQTRRLTPAQFDELLARIEPFVGASVNPEVRGYAKELRALFLLQRWAGLRILDALLLPRTGLVGNLLSLVTKKTGAKIEDRPIPPYVADALRDLSPDRPAFRPTHFLWSVGMPADGKKLRAKWVNIITAMNKHLDFKNEDKDGEPMNFHSHMLRDTYAVELLLAGVDIADVSKLLTHTSIQTTERHYAPWVKPRLQQLDAKLIAAMKKMGIEFAA
jgi:integrase